MEFDLAVFRSKDYIHIRVPFEYHFILFYLLAVPLEDARSVRNVIVHKILTVIVYDMYLGIPCKGNSSLFPLLCDFKTLIIFYNSRYLGVHLGPGGNDACDSADVECTKSQLCSRLSDTLGSHDTDCLPDIRHLPCSEISAIAANAKTALGFTGQRRTDRHCFDRTVFNLISYGFNYLLACAHDKFFCYRIVNVVKRNPSKDSVLKKLFDLFTFFKSRD